MRTRGGQECGDAANSARPGHVLLVTGMSGAGRSTALKILEDIGYETFDNFPAALLPALLQSAADGTAIAVGADVRTRGFAPETLIDTLANIAVGNGRELRVVFIDCDDDRLERRYTETRRPHPLAGGRPALDGIRHERQMLSSLRVRSDLLIDTSTLTATQLKRLLIGHFALDAARLRVFVASFAYRQGLPREADLVFDVRFLENPHYIDGLRALTGCDPAVAARIERDAGFTDFFDRLRGLLLTLLPRYEASGKAYLTIAVGCTGGRHRSVYVAERLAACLRDAGWQTELAHRDLSPYATDAPDMTGANAAGVH